MILCIPILNMMMRRVRVVRFLHTETQDGKGDCDAHGAVAERHIDINWIRSRDDKLDYKKVTTQEELAMAISCKGGIKNNGKFHFQIDRILQLVELADCCLSLPFINSCAASQCQPPRSRSAGEEIE
jgi:hypothetical protein